MLVRTAIALVVVALPFVAEFSSKCDWAPFRKLKSIAGSGQTTPFRTQGRASEIALSNPFGIHESADGSLIVASFDQHCVYRIDASYSTVEVIAGTGKAGASGAAGEPAQRAP